MDSKSFDATPAQSIQRTAAAPESCFVDKLRRFAGVVIQERRIIFLSLVVNFGALLFGYDSGIAGAIIVLPSFQKSFGIRGSAQQVANISSNIVSILYGGAFFGALLAAWTSYRFGRRRSLLLGCVFFIVGGTVQVTSTKVAQIYVGRLLAGFGVGAVSQVCPIFVSECASKQHRSVAVAMFQMCLVTGGMFAYWIGYSVSVHVSGDRAEQWRIPIGMQLLPSALFTLGLLFVPESPRFLAFRRVQQDRQRIQQGLQLPSRFPPSTPSPYSFQDIDDTTRDSVQRNEYITELPRSRLAPAAEASETDLVAPRGKSAIDRVFKGLFDRHNLSNDPLAPIRTLAFFRNVPMSTPSLQAEMAEIYAQLDEIEEDRAQGRTHWRALVKIPSVRKRMAIGGFMGAWQIWTAQNAILYYAPTIFMSIGFSSSSTSLLASGVFTCLKVISTIAALSLTVNRYGRVVGLSVGGLLQGLIFFVLGILLATNPVNAKDSPSSASFAMMAMIYVYVLVYSFTLGPLPWVYASEIFPPHYRDAGQLGFVLLTWANNYAIARVTPLGFTNIGWRLWLVYASLNIGGAAICWAFCPETKGKSMEEIDIVFGAITEEERSSHVANLLRRDQPKPPLSPYSHIDRAKKASSTTE